jgi:hypothetical protein
MTTRFFGGDAMSYQLPQPKMTVARWHLLNELLRTGAPLEETITMTVDGVPASITPAPAGVRGMERSQLTCVYGSDRACLDIANLHNVSRLDLALQVILADAIRARPPAPVALDDLEFRRLPGLVTDVDAAVVAYRDLLHRRTGIAWSVRVGSRKHRGTITIASEPKARVGGRMTARDCALLAALTGRALVNPASGFAVADHVSDRSAAASAFAGVELAAEQRRLG